jgi:hypothetical protein
MPALEWGLVILSTAGSRVELQHQLGTSLVVNIRWMLGVAPHRTLFFAFAGSPSLIVGGRTVRHAYRWSWDLAAFSA